MIYALSRRSAMRACVTLFVLAGVARVGVVEVGRQRCRSGSVYAVSHGWAGSGGLARAGAVRGPGGLRQYLPAARIVFAVTSLVLLPTLVLHLRLLTLVDTLWTIECAAAGDDRDRIAHNLAGTPGASSPLHWLGKYSYGMYLFANLLIPVLAAVLTAGGLAALFGSNLAGQLAYLVIMSLATAGVAVLSWHCYEKHFLKLKARFQ